METSKSLVEWFNKQVLPPDFKVSNFAKPLKILPEMTMECKFEPQEMKWDVEYAVEMFSETMTKKERAAVQMEGYLPVYRTGTEEVIGRAYLSKVVPVNMNKGEPPVTEITITLVEEKVDDDTK